MSPFVRRGDIIISLKVINRQMNYLQFGGAAIYLWMSDNNKLLLLRSALCLDFVRCKNAVITVGVLKIVYVTLNIRYKLELLWTTHFHPQHNFTLKMSKQHSKFIELTYFVKHDTNGKKCYIENEVITIRKFLIGNRFVEFGRHIFKLLLPHFLTFTAILTSIVNFLLTSMTKETTPILPL